MYDQETYGRGLLGNFPQFFFFFNCIHTTIFDSDSEIRDSLTVCVKEKREKNKK